MREYDLITIGTGSAMSIVEAMIREKPDLKVAVIDKDEPGGICLTRGCIPSKILLYPAELIRTVEGSDEFGIRVKVEGIDFEKVMNRMRTLIHRDIDGIRDGLSKTESIDYYPQVAEFVAPYTLKVNNEVITAKMIFLCCGSRPMIPRIDGLEDTGYLTSDTLLNMTKLPRSVAIIGGSYVAAEYGHFLSAMGADVTIIGRNPQFLPEEEPEVSALAKRELSKHVRILTNHEVTRVERSSPSSKKLISVNRANGQNLELVAEEILLAAGRESNSDLLHPELGGVKTDNKGWILVNEYLETSRPNVWALGDAIGKHQFKHVANYEALIVYSNAVLGKKLKADYHAVPHAVFMSPEVASVGLGEKEAVRKYGPSKVLIGIHRYQDTARGEAIGARDYFVKVIVEADTLRILGAHIIGPHASILIQEIIDVMYSAGQAFSPIVEAMHIHPAMNEVVERAFRSLMTPEQYHHVIEHHLNLPTA
ncbi:MAG TPA: dihydrolipoyl dehydrogenase [Thermoproteota archaeon]|nr:dihydrolipoyl dehydrogenase [Thermoproteota archaeon]